MRELLLYLVLLVPILLSSSITWVNDGADGWATGDDWDAANVVVISNAVNSIDAGLDALFTIDDCVSPPCSLAAGTTINNVPIQVGPLTGDVITSGTNATIQPNAITGGEITDSSVAESKLSFPVATQADLDAKSATTTTTLNAVPRFSTATGKLVDSGVLISATNNVIIPGTLTVGGSQLGARVVSAIALVDRTTPCATNGDEYFEIDGTPRSCVCIDAAIEDWACVSLTN